MTRLTDTQLVILSSAAQREDGGVLLADRPESKAAESALKRLLSLNMIEEVPPADSPRPLGCTEPVITMRITDAGLAAIGIDTDGAAGDGELVEVNQPDHQAASNPPAEGRSTKLTLVLNLLARPEGASQDEIMAATGWQRHSVRGMIAGTVKKKLGRTVLSEKLGEARVYRIVAEEASA